MKFARMQNIVMLTLLLSLVPLASGCQVTPQPPSYTLPFAPITFTIDTTGNISVAADLVTELGTFSVGVSSIQPEDGALLLTIRHKQKGSIVDTVYKIQTGQDEVTIVVDGTTTIQVMKKSILIDASKGTIKSIKVTGSSSPLHLGDLLYTYSGHDPGLLGWTDNVYAVAWSPDGKRIASGGGDSTVQVWDAADGGNASIYRGHDRVRTVAWSPDGKRIASGSNDGTVQVWNAANGGNVYTYHQGDLVWAVAWSPDGKRIASGSDDGTVQIRDATNGGNVYTYHQGVAVTTVAWSPDGKRIASAGDDTTVQVWWSAE